MKVTRAAEYLAEVSRSSRKIRFGKECGFGAMILMLSVVCVATSMGERIWFSAFLLEFGLQICAGIALLGVILASAARYFLGVAASAVGFGLSWLFFIQPSIVPKGAKATDKTLKVMSFNIANNEVEKGDGLLLSLALDKADADVLLIQEALLMRDDPTFRETFNGHEHLMLTRGLALALKKGKTKLVQVRDLDFTDSAPYQNRFGQIIVLDWQGKLFTIVHVQLRDERMPMEESDPFPNPRRTYDWQEKATQSAPVYRERVAMFDKLVGELRKLKGPVLVVGDLGFAPNGQMYATLVSRFGDAFARTSTGPGQTSPKGRTSYVFLSHHWKAVSSKVISTKASSHAPLVAELQLDVDESNLVHIEKIPAGELSVSDPETDPFNKRKDEPTPAMRGAKETGPTDKPKPKGAKSQTQTQPAAKVVYRRSAWAPMYGRDVTRMVQK